MLNQMNQQYVLRIDKKYFMNYFSGVEQKLKLATSVRLSLMK